MARRSAITLAVIGAVGVVTLYRATESLRLDWASPDDLGALALAAVPYLALAGAAGLCRRWPVMLSLILASTALVGFLLIGATTVGGGIGGQEILGLWAMSVMLAAFVCLVCVLVCVACLVIRRATRAARLARA